MKMWIGSVKFSVPVGKWEFPTSVQDIRAFKQFLLCWAQLAWFHIINVTHIVVVVNITGLILLVIIAMRVQVPID
jgi:hypothetical protein